jgi:hypothetical protein
MMDKRADKVLSHRVDWCVMADHEAAPSIGLMPDPCKAE